MRTLHEIIHENGREGELYEPYPRQRRMGRETQPTRIEFPVSEQLSSELSFLIHSLAYNRYGRGGAMRKTFVLSSTVGALAVVLSLTAILLAISLTIFSADSLAQTQMVLVTTSS